MMEYEVKAEVTRDEFVVLKNKFMILGAKYKHREETVDVYFDKPNKDLLIDDKSFRVRQEFKDDLRFFISYKGPKIDEKTKSREERLYQIDSPDVSLKNLITLFNDLGYETIAKVTKGRDVYMFGNIVICLDEVENLGYFVELEYNTRSTLPSINVDIPQLLLGFADMMNLKKQERRSYLELVLEDARN